MGIREWANGHPKATASAVGGCVVLVAGVAVIQAVSGHHGFQTKPPNSYYTTDDGKTWFSAPMNNYAPFDHNGQVAVGAYVFQCGGKKFVGYLERYLPDAKHQLDAGGQMTPQIVRYGREVKRPGDTTWFRTGDITAESKIENVSCPDGSSKAPDEVEP